MRIFICEFITSGGFSDSELPANLVDEGEMMFAALAGDLLDAGYRDIVCTRDKRLANPVPGIRAIAAGENIWNVWQSLFRECDAAWIIAPETDNVLYRLVQLAESCNCRVIGCSSGFIKLATSKRQTREWLQKHHIPVPPVYNPACQQADKDNGWIVKPDDGVGGDEVFFFPDVSSLKKYLQHAKSENRLIEEYVPGVPASMSVFFCKGKALLLGCNEQCFTFGNDGKGHLEAVIVNGLRRHHEVMNDLAGKIAAALPDEVAYTGIDLVVTDRGLTVIEINPRLTTSYAGLRESLGVNPAGLILSLMQHPETAGHADFKYHPVRINI